MNLHNLTSPPPDSQSGSQVNRKPLDTPELGARESIQIHIHAIQLAERLLDLLWEPKHEPASFRSTSQSPTSTTMTEDDSFFDVATTATVLRLSEEEVWTLIVSGHLRPIAMTDNGQPVFDRTTVKPKPNLHSDRGAGTAQISEPQLQPPFQFER